MTIKALFLDLDDTLLTNDMMEVFVPTYLPALAAHVAQAIGPEKAPPLADFVRQIMLGTQQMMANTNPNRTLIQEFGSVFYAPLGLQADSLAPALADFYANQFPQFKQLTTARPTARPLVEWAFAQGLQVVIATNPLFPRAAIEHRLDWAGLPLAEFPSLTLSAYEDYHFAKPQPSYYAELLARHGLRPSEALMIGNDWTQDILPAASVGLATYWIAPPEANPPTTDLAGSGLTQLGDNPHPGLAGHGTLEQCFAWLQDPQRLAELNPTLPYATNPISLLARLKATIAALDAALADLPANLWLMDPQPENWSLSEIVQHLVEAETMVLQPRLKLVLTEENPFIAAFDIDAAAKARRADFPVGAAAQHAFIQARVETIAQIAHLSPEAWLRPCRHTLFGPTYLYELVEIHLEHDLQHLADLRNLRADLTA